MALKKQISQTLEKNCKEKLIKEAKNLCPNERPKELAPELIIVFDASGSMDLSLMASTKELSKRSRLPGSSVAWDRWARFWVRWQEQPTTSV